MSNAHTTESFSHQQLTNYIEVGKVAAQVKLRKELGLFDLLDPSTTLPSPLHHPSIAPPSPLIRPSFAPHSPLIHTSR